MALFIALVGLVAVLATLLDAFEVVLLPRPVRRRFRVNRYFFRWTWAGWSWMAQRLPDGRRREDFIGVFGPLSMVSLFATWASCLIAGFGLLHWALQQWTHSMPIFSMAEAMVVSGDAFFTLGYGDVVPRHTGGRLLVILEAGTGFGFIALTIAYLPVLYQHFSRRDYQLIDLSARAGTPAAANALLQWHAAAGGPAALNQWLREWEIWASDLVESHSAYPMLAFYRSQHEGHSWLTALSVVLETCSLIISSARDGGPPQAAATYSAAHRVLNVVVSSLDVAPLHSPAQRNADLQSQPAKNALEALVPDFIDDAEAVACLSRLKQAYEPSLLALSSYLLMPLQQTLAAAHPATQRGSRREVVDRLTLSKPSDD